MLAPTPYSWQPPYELKLFGKALNEVRLSSILTFSPDLVSRVVFDRSLNSWLRSEPELDRAFKDLLRGATRKNKLSQTTQKRVRQTLLDFVPPSLIPLDVMQKMLNGEDVAESENEFAGWGVVLQGIEAAKTLAGETDKQDYLHEIIKVLADCENYGEQITRYAKQGNADAALNFKNLEDEAQEAWCALEPRFKHFLLIPREKDGKFRWAAYKKVICSQIVKHPSEWAVGSPAVMLIEVALKTLALAECRMSVFEPESDVNASILDELLKPGKYPMGNWLGEVCKVYACANLAKLATELLRRRKLYSDKPIDHNLLRTWSSVKGLTPPRAMRAVLADMNLLMVNRLMLRFYLARCFSFLCDFLQASVIGNERPAWNEVQVFLWKRYRQVYHLQVASPAPMGLKARASENR